MDHHRAQTLQALEAFVETQRVLLARQRADIETLHRLKTDLAQRPSQILSHLTEELDGNAFRMSEQVDCRLKLPKEINWASFDHADAGHLRAFAQRTKEDINQRNQPCPIQRSNLSDLQQLVKRARRVIVDPILIHFQNMSSPEPESEEEVDPVERKRALERQKIRELKKRQIRGGLSLPLSSHSGSLGVFIRHDVADEDMNVDVSIDDGEDHSTPSVSMRLDPTPPPQPPTQSRPYATKAIPTLSPPSNSRRRSTTKNVSKMKEEDYDTYVPRKTKTPQRSMSPASDDDIPKAPKARGGGTKPKPETYKQAWSTSEQNLLEQLLEEIPEGEKFRWQKISKAMGGRRTPRQVASRVQKYFEKLKKFSLL